jgi:uncharacterized protein (DUF1684 family)
MGESASSVGRCAIALLVAALAAACGRPAPDESFAGRLVAARAMKDEAFRSSPESPIPPDKREAFLPLAYFPPDQSYVASASLAPVGAGESAAMDMPTSTGTVRPMRRVGTLEFMLKGRSLRLTAFVEAGEQDTDRLFVPFTDLTTGTETYPAGRYLELDRTPTGIYTVDFNRAFNPYCYYNPTYDCPFPPPENRLTVPVRAGERISLKAK